MPRPHAPSSPHRLGLLAAALCAAWAAAARAEDGEMQASVSVGVGAVDGGRAERTLFDQYSGLRPGRSAVGLFGAEYWRRDAGSGRTVEFRATDLFSDNRELGLRWQQPGDWKISAELRELTRRETATVNTGLLGLGSATPRVVALAGGAGSGVDHDLKTTRTRLGVALQKQLGPRLQLDVGLSSENKRGERLWGTGFTCPSALAPACGGSTGTEAGWTLLLLPEPVDANHSQVQARLSWSLDALQLSAGYHGSFYRNSLGSLVADVPASLYNGLGTLLPLSSGLPAILAQPVALPPDNQAHQLDLRGSYAFSRSTVLNFKLGYTRATQDQDFASAGLVGAPAGVAHLDGTWVTTLGQAGIVARPLPRLTLRADVRYEDRDDRTPLELYVVEGATSYTNRQLPLTKVRGRAQASYQFTPAVRGSLGVEGESIDRGTLDAGSAVSGLTALRQQTDETTVRADFRARVSETLSGGLRVASSRRDGSNWLRDNSGLGVTEVEDPGDASTGFALGVFMPTLADRRRDTWALHAHWQPLENLSLQLAAQDGRDRFRMPSAYGLRSTRTNQASLDWDYALSERWSFNGYLSGGKQTLHQARPAGVIMSFDNDSTGLGLGFSGKPVAKLEVGGSLGYLEDRSAYVQTLEAQAPPELAVLLAATGGLPDIVFRQSTLKLFGKYALDERSALRVELVHQRSRWTDWAWGHGGQPFVYSDGSTVRREPLQQVSFVGVVYTYAWR